MSLHFKISVSLPMVYLHICSAFTLPKTLIDDFPPKNHIQKRVQDLDLVKQKKKNSTGIVGSSSLVHTILVFSRGQGGVNVVFVECSWETK